VRGDEPDPPYPLDRGNPPQKFREGDLPFLLPVGVDVLSQQDDFHHSAPGESADLREDIPGRPAHFPPPDQGNDAVGAEIVASLHDGDHRRNRAGGQVRNDVPVRHLLIHPEGHRREAAFRPPDHLGKARDVVGTEDDVDVGGPLPEHLPVLLGQTTPDSDEPSRASQLPAAQGTEITIDLLVGFLADTAGVQEDEVRLLEGGGGKVIGRGHEREHPRRVHGVHLASERLDEDRSPHGSRL
jgi:hypothetical protein